MSETPLGQASESQSKNLDLESLAKLCSVGVVPIPNDLPDPERKELYLKIAARRRKRLLHLFAAAIAEDILREQHCSEEQKLSLIHI